MNAEQIKAALAESSTQPIPLPDWQTQELDSRYREFTEGKLALHDGNDVHEELRARSMAIERLEVQRGKRD